MIYRKAKTRFTLLSVLSIKNETAIYKVILLTNAIYIFIRFFAFLFKFDSGAMTAILFTSLSLK